jgi:hypothetical protein
MPDGCSAEGGAEGGADGSCAASAATSQNVATSDHLPSPTRGEATPRERASPAAASQKIASPTRAARAFSPAGKGLQRLKSYEEMQ